MNHLRSRILLGTVAFGLIGLSGSLQGCSGAGGQDPALQPWFATDPLVAEIVGQISRENIETILKGMESFETRHTQSESESDTRGIGGARRWLMEQVKAYSPRLEVYLDSWVSDADTPGRLPEGTELMNVTAVLPGTHPELSKQHIILSGHYDSLNLDQPLEGDTYERRDPNRPAPGVNDDISGVAVAMECARVFSQYEFPKTLVFVGFVAEEQGLVGASLLARKMKAEGKEIEAVLNMDMIGSSVRGGGAPSQPTTVRLFSDGPEDSPSRQIARFMEMIGERYVPEQDIDLIFRRDRFGRGGDHTAFNGEGFPGVRLVEANEDYNNQHSYNDTFANLDMDYLMRNARIEAVTAATLALAPSAPAPAGLGRGEGYDAQVRFMPAVGEGITGYVIALRSTTSPRWEEYRWVGIPEMVTGGRREYMQVTFPHMDIDEIVVGVAAVGGSGRPSLISAFLR
ncbi:M20/M25/M40 family metallo-hydrolase [Gemmatimonadota bacterium]